MATNLNCAEVRVGLTGHLWTAPVGTLMPTDVTTPMATPWVDLGYTTEDGLSMSVDTNKEDMNVWQSLSPCRSVVTSQTYTTTFTLVQRNAATLKVAFGGGTVTALTPGPGVKYTPPPAGLAEAAFVYEVIDGTITDRYLMYRGNPALTGDVSFTKSDMTGYQIEVTHLGTIDGVWALLTNDPHVTVGTELEGFQAAQGYVATNDETVEPGQEPRPADTSEAA